MTAGTRKTTRLITVAARRFWWLILLTAVAGATAGTAAAQQAHSRFHCSSDVYLFAPLTPDKARNPKTPAGNLNMDTEIQMAYGTRTEIAAAATLGDTAGTRPGRAMSATAMKNTSILRISYTATDPQHACTGAAAFARAYLQGRQDDIWQAVTSRREALQATHNQLAADLAVLHRQLASGQVPAAQQSIAIKQRNATQAQLRQLTTSLTDLPSTPPQAGRIIAATAPAPLGGGKRAWLPTTGLITGAAAGVLAAVIRQNHMQRQAELSADSS